MKNLSLFVTLAATLAIGTGLVYASNYEGNKESERDHRYDRNYGGKLDVAPVNNAQYKEECGSCHMAFQPGFLPARSWEKLMNGLEDHFGESAEMELADQKVLTDYLKENAADQSDYKRSRSFSRSIAPNAAPLRITEVRYFIKEHDELSRRMVQDNPEVKSFSKCEACHQSAEQGSYDEYQIRIPGYGRWDD